jgi:hypothetical protein
MNEDQNRIQLPVNELSAGTYIVQAKTAKGSFGKKIIIK